ncbi:MAG: hypothetical protein K2Y08_07290 [Alphaproteobacteria bacterium]|nr:hypothetical protein [Alphaproteobacteria bacterium]
MIIAFTAPSEDESLDNEACTLLTAPDPLSCSSTLEATANGFAGAAVP